MRVLGEGIDGLMIVEAKVGFSRSCLRDWSNGIEDVLDVTSRRAKGCFYDLPLARNKGIRQSDPRVLNCDSTKDGLTSA